jgi:hypothetical protein
VLSVANCRILCDGRNGAERGRSVERCALQLTQFYDASGTPPPRWVNTQNTRLSAHGSITCAVATSCSFDAIQRSPLGVGARLKMTECHTLSWYLAPSGNTLCQVLSDTGVTEAPQRLDA